MSFATVRSDVGNGNVQVRCTICYCYYVLLTCQW